MTSWQPKETRPRADLELDEAVDHLSALGKEQARQREEERIGNLLRLFISMARSYQRADDDPRPMFFWTETEILDLAMKKFCEKI